LSNIIEKQRLAAMSSHKSAEFSAESSEADSGRFPVVEFPGIFGSSEKSARET
jgi:hypothetical protein